MELYLFTGPGKNSILQDLLRFRYDVDRAAGLRAAQGLLAYAARRGKSRDTLREYAIRELLDSPGAGERLDEEERLQPYFMQDITEFYEAFFAFDWEAHCKSNGLLPFPKGIAAQVQPQWLRAMVEAPSKEVLEKEVRAFYRMYHDRDEARYTAFRWKDSRLEGIRRADQMRFECLAGLSHQKDALQRNARAFLQGLPAHNVLLVGGSGTGKSSCVKATLTEFADQGLRLVELAKQQVGQLPVLMEALNHKKCKYIIYIDDLSFEEVDEGYKELKVALEGQLEEKASNVLIYVTSNRRHLIKEVWKDRDPDGEIHENDTHHEKMSLSERFGLHLTFGVLNQKEYFDVIALLLAQQGLEFTDDIGREAAAWALTYNGRSGRTAKQFVMDYSSRQRGE